jgi:ketosteroid isomerase-like protein
MGRFKTASLVVLGFAALASCTKTAPPASDTTAVAAAAAPDTAADMAAVRAINPVWFKAFNSGDVATIVSLYADDAGLSVPGAAPIKGKTGIQEAYTKEMRDFVAAGMSQTPGPSGEFGVSGDLGYEWNTFTVIDKSRKTVDTGKYVTVFARMNGKWVIVQDTWNSDMPPAPAK